MPIKIDKLENISWKVPKGNVTGERCIQNRLRLYLSASFSLNCRCETLLQEELWITEALQYGSMQVEPNPVDLEVTIENIHLQLTPNVLAAKCIALVNHY